MTIDEMIAVLQEAREELGGHCEVVLGDQPNYPFECSIASTCVDRTLNDGEGAIVLCEGRQKGYGKRLWWSETEIQVGEDFE